MFTREGKMTFLELVRKRQSTREFLDRPVEREKIQRCVEAARLAPSACNSQPWKFIVIDKPELRTAVAQRLASPVLGINAFAAQAPLLIAVVTEPSTLTARLGAMLKDKPYHLMDLGIAVEHFCLQAVEEGLGTCIMGWFDETGVKRLLEVPRGKRVHLTVAVGYAASEVVRPKARKERGDILAFNGYAAASDSTQVRRME
jgi:nitroreductase